MIWLTALVSLLLFVYLLVALLRPSGSNDERLAAMWLLPVLIVGTTVALSIPVGRYLAWIMDGRYRAPRWLRWIEQRLDTGPQNWKQYTLSLLLFNTVMFVFGFVVLALQPLLAAQSRRQEDAGADDDLQHGLLVRDQHEPAALLGRAAPVLLQPARRSSSGTCSSRRRSASAPWRRSFAACAATPHMGNLLPRHVARRRLRRSCRPACVDGRAADGRRRADDLRPGRRSRRSTDAWARREGIAAPGDRPRPGGGHHADQAPGHQRRRLLRRQLGPPVREPQRLDQLPRRASTS